MWKGRPWVAPAILARTIIIIIVGAALTWFESTFGIAMQMLYGIPTLLWTYLGLVVTWLASLVSPIFRRASRAYVLRNDNLEVQSGIVRRESITLSPIGFSDIELKQDISQRILNIGDIIVRSDSGRVAKIEEVRNPVKISDMIRDVMTKPRVLLQRDSDK